ncbi:MAG: hypothetical protein KIT62_05115 [Cyclobacteriaceae bacterium]|nr:hypothetical protein [Cyclobacteriaceae bacterium]
MRKSVLITTLLAGTLDIVAACIHAYVANGVTPAQVLTYIASGLLGKAAYSGGIEVQLLGLAAHYLIAFACTFSFYWAYPKWRMLHISTALNAFLICITAWLVTTQVVVRFSYIGLQPVITSKALIAIAILFVCIGLPIAWRAGQYFKRKDL